ncbi:MAG: hypothetical protein PVJ84_02940 [Desulfobacteraceae bacterium]
MMDPSPGQHLAYDDLLRTLVDGSDLSAEQQSHLKSCPGCQRQAQDLQSRYRRLGQMARDMAPGPSRPFRVPVHDTPTPRWYFKPGVAAGILGVLIFVFTVWWPRPPEYSGAPAPVASWSVEQEMRWMAEVDALVEDALPKAYQQVAVVSEPILSQDLIDWIVPSIDEDDDHVDPTA